MNLCFSTLFIKIIIKYIAAYQIYSNILSYVIKYFTSINNHGIQRTTQTSGDIDVPYGVFQDAA